VFEDEMLTIEDLAAYLKLKPQTIYKWAQTGKIPGAKFGKEWRFRRSTIEAWIDDNFPPRSESTQPRKEGEERPEVVIPPTEAPARGSSLKDGKTSRTALAPALSPPLLRGTGSSAGEEAAARKIEQDLGAERDKARMDRRNGDVGGPRGPARKKGSSKASGRKKSHGPSTS
jgi:excisionase family DNA binding protein